MSYDNAEEVVPALAGHKLNHDQDDYLAIMAKLVEDYESENVPEPKPVKEIDALKSCWRNMASPQPPWANSLGVANFVFAFPHRWRVPRFVPSFMEPAVFRELFESVRDAGTYLRGNRKGVVRANGVSPRIARSRVTRAGVSRKRPVN